MRSSVKQISWAESRAANLANWEDRVPIHLQSYGLELFTNPDYLTEQVRDDLAVLQPFVAARLRVKPAMTQKVKPATRGPRRFGHRIGGVRMTQKVEPATRGPRRFEPLAGLSVCHLQCHIGADTLSLARAGAELVVGIDFSASAIKVASQLAKRHDAKAKWLQADVLAARAAVTKALGDINFDLVYTSTGTIEWLNDLNLWAQQIAALLKPGGLFYLNDSHPMLYVFDDLTPGIPKPIHRYFPDGTPIALDASQSYSGTGQLSHSRTYCWPHSLSEIITALVGAGLHIEYLAEGQTISWRYHPSMVEVAPGKYAWPAPYRNNIPVTFTLIASKQAAQ